MKHQSKQMLAWVVSIGASTAVFGAGSWMVRKIAPQASHIRAPESEAHAPESEAGDSPGNSDHPEEKEDVHAATEQGEEHGRGELSKERGRAAHDANHNLAEQHEDEHTSGEHSAEQKGADHGEEHAAAEHAKDHAAAEHSEEHTNVEHGEQKTEHKTSPSHWSYDRNAADGPNSWGKLSGDFAACEKGREQSPIDLIGAQRSAAAPKLTFHYVSSEVAVENNGYTIQSTLVNDQNYVLIDDEKFNLAQFHFHNPGEHRIGGNPYDMEMHLVHKNRAGKLAVIGVLIKEERKGENPYFKTLWELLPREIGTKVETNPTVNLLSMLPKHRQFFHYAGSLTTPPCSEGVRWFVMQEPISMSPGQVEMYSSIFQNLNTNRPVQPVFTRQIIESIGPTDVAH